MIYGLTFVRIDRTAGSFILLAAALLVALRAFVWWIGTDAPAYAATVDLRVPDAVVTAELFDNGSASEFERYLTIRTPGDELRVAMIEDWGPAHRTSLYLAGPNELAILGPAGDDYYLTLRPLGLTAVVPPDPDLWVYLGAFDLVRSVPGDAVTRSLTFVRPSEQAECIPLLGARLSAPPRPAALQHQC